MSNFSRRAKSFIDRVHWLGPYIGGPVPAAAHLVKIKIGGEVEGAARYGQRPFRFYPRDMSAIREVLADQEYSFLEPVLRQQAAPVVLDVGAHIGLFSLWVLDAAPTARILSLEASAVTFETLSKNAALSGGDWQIMHGAAWSCGESVAFAAEGDSMGHKIAPGGCDNVQGVPMAKLFDAMKSERITILKIDIEGAEETFVCGGEEFLERVDHVVIELHPKACDTEKVRHVLGKYFNNIEARGGRLSTKPLLHCYRG